METEQPESTEKKRSKEDCVVKEELSIVCILHKIKFRAGEAGGGGRGGGSQSIRNLSGWW